jgi:DNA-binding NtrC family response regulator
VRELANALEHAVILSEGGSIAPDDLPGNLTARLHRNSDLSRPSDPEVLSIRPMTLQQMEREMILVTLDRNAGDKPKTAADLGIALKTLYNKLNQYQADSSAHAG